MSTDIVAIVGHQQALPAQYKGMVERISDALPAIRRDASNFHKGHSQYMYAMLDVTPLTTIRSIKQTLAEIDRTQAALEEAHISQRRKEIERAEKIALMAAGDNPSLAVDIDEIDLQLARSTNSMQGAIRKLSYMVAQYQALMAKLGKTELTEADYEADEARYHIMTVMKQALCAARARGGIIDEGNQIYLFDAGLPAAEAQARVMSHLRMEEQMLAQGQPVTHEMTMQFLERCADDWAGCSAQFAARRGVPMIDHTSLHSA